MATPQDVSVLLAEDDEDLRNLLSSQFRRAGFKVIAAPNGRDALIEALENSIDVVVTDVRMALGDGNELLRIVKKHHQDMPVFLITANDDAVDTNARRKAAGVFLKPFPFSELIEAV